MNRIAVIPVLMILFTIARGQSPVGSWSDHLVYSTAQNVAVGSKEIYASTGSSIIAYNREFSELRKISGVNGLTETGISSISWSEDYNTLVIGYNSSNVDLLVSNTIYNIPDIKNKYSDGDKKINRIRTHGRYAYLACSFGIIVIDLQKKEIYDTWKPGRNTDPNEIFDLTFGNNIIYTATETGVYFATLTDPGLSYFGKWRLLDILPFPDALYNTLVFSGNKLYSNRPDPSGDYVYATETSSSVFLYSPGINNFSFDKSADGFTFSSSSSAKYFNNDGSLNKTITSYGWGTPLIMQAVEDNGDIWIADKSSGLVRGTGMNNFTALILPGPLSNNTFNITSLNGKTIICAGGVDYSWNSLSRPLEISVHENNKWNSLTLETVYDPLRSAFDKNNNNHFFVSAWGCGLLEYLDNNLVNHYTESNSPLQASGPGQLSVKVYGLAFDKSGNLWMTQSGVTGSIKVLKPDGSWIVNPLTTGAPVTGDILITKTGHKWIILPEGHGLFILDDNNTPEAFNDDRSMQMYVHDNENLVVTTVISLAEDLDGNIWVGTDQGPLIYYNPERVFDEDLKAFRIKIPRKDGSGLADYILKTEKIISISVDGANRKWLGTAGSGAYHISADGTALIKNFNEENSPVFSDSIISVAVDNKTGDVWFGTPKGVQSFRGDANEGGKAFTNVYTYPNPVREDYTGIVTITGLMTDSEIRITDISGNLVYETVSNGGMATWDLHTYTGKRVTTGVYLVFCASNDGSESFVTKMLVIKPPTP